MSLSLGIVGGGGWLGSAIARAVLGAGLVSPDALTLSYRSRKPEGFDGVRLVSDSREVATHADVVILSVRPEDWPALDFSAQGKLVVSVMAGVPLAALIERHGSGRVIRALPNAAAEVGASYTPFVAAGHASGQDRETVRRIFECCGTVDEYRDELHLDYLSGLTGTGPAYPSLMAAAMVADAVARGIPEPLALRAVSGLFVGTGRMMEAHPTHPEQTVETFMAYRGVTAAGLSAMQSAGLEAAVRNGLEQALARTLAMARGDCVQDL